MVRTTIWGSIAATLREEIAGGQYRAGDRLPTEAQLSARFGVNRHTVRQALAALADEGLLHTRRGAGVFVTGRQIEYPIGRRVRFHQNLLAAGQTPERRILHLETRAASAEEAEALRLAPGAEVHLREGLSYADDVPIAIFRSVFPAAALPGLFDALRMMPSVTEALARAGVGDVIRASTRLTAVRATPTQALHLRLRDGAPLLRSVAINTAPDGRPVEHGHAWFAGERVTLNVLPDGAEGEDAP